jgi:methyl-accepting chemotaxis protein
MANSSMSLEEAVSHRDCELGQWLYGGALERYRHVPGMRELEPLHQRMHEVVHEVVRLKNDGRLDAARKVYEQVAPLSRQVIDYIEEISNNLS